MLGQAKKHNIYTAQLENQNDVLPEDLATSRYLQRVVTLPAKVRKTNQNYVRIRIKVADVI